jgi:hypothetical protein
LTELPSNYSLVPDFKIDETIEYSDYDGYVPEKVLRDLLNMSSHHVLGKSPEECIVIPSDYCDSLLKLFRKLNTSIIDKKNSPVHIAVSILKKMHLNGIDFRMLEAYREDGLSVDECFANTFNYKFDIRELSDEIIDFLNINDDQVNQIEELPSEIIEILNFSNDFGQTLFASRLVTTVDYGKMKSYGEITKVKKSLMARPDFLMKYAIKQTDVKYQTDKVEFGNRLIIGFSTSAKLSSTVSLIQKLLGVLILTCKDKGYHNEVTMYVDFGTEIVKYNLGQSVELFRSSIQLSMFNRHNNEFLSHLTFREPNSTILFIPIADHPCALSSTSLNGCRVHMITSSKSKFANRYEYMCAKTGGKVVLV